MNISNLGQKKILDNINLFLILILPISLVAGSLIANILILLIISFVFLKIFINKDIYLFKNNFLYFSYILWIYLIICSVTNFEDFNALDKQSLIRSLGFIRYIFLSIALGYYIKKFGNETILKAWAIIFLFVTLDLIFENFTGSNLLGFKSNYPGRLGGLTGEEVKIGGFYFGFVLLTLAFIYQKKNRLVFPFAILFLIISLTIGERANFFKIFLTILFFLFLIDKNKFKKKIIFFLISILILISAISVYANFQRNDLIKARFYKQLFLNNSSLSFIENLKKASPHYSHYVTSVEIFKDNPIFGVGLKKFRKVSHQEKYNSLAHGFYGGSTHPHQVHFEWLVETGMVGYIMFFSFFCYYIVCGVKEYINKENIFLLSSIIFLLVSFFPLIPSGSFFTTFTATIFWINFGFFIGNSKVAINLK